MYTAIGNPDVDRLLESLFDDDETASEEISAIIAPRFNFNGEKPQGTRRIVGLIDKHVLWSFLMDPFAKELLVQVVVDDVASQVNAMLATYIPGNGKEIENKRARVKREFAAFLSQTGEWAHRFNSPPPPAMSLEEAKKAQATLTVKNVSDWVKATGGHEARIQWFEAWAPRSELYLLVAKPLLSIRATGSIDTERIAKPLKRYIKTKERNRLSDERAEICLRAGINLRNLRAARQSLGI